MNRFMFSLLLSLACTSSASPSTTCLHVCICFKDLKLVDCSREKLTEVPTSNVIMRSYTSFSLRDNKLSQVNLSSIRIMLPNLRNIDLKGNPIDCGYLWSQSVPKRLKILTDCAKQVVTTTELTTTYASREQTSTMNETVTTPSPETVTTPFPLRNHTYYHVHQGVESSVIYGPILGVVFLIAVVLLIHRFYRRRTPQSAEFQMVYHPAPAPPPSIISSSEETDPEED